ncbi:hypothetical protein QBC40DRAFT_85718 [Triangularia verruculosa]|uniref:Transmembrane protein n=1 Tax=Triangularia verruculosa TaxID=2587418 RepID=A0AAN6XFC6_9PEZI|nr:hypothetical protein QBC40DRAFT_85718 [Triangularia verruculosa]
MARQRRWPPDMLLGFFLCSIVVLCDGAATRIPLSEDIEYHSDPIHISPQHRLRTPIRQHQDAGSQLNYTSIPITTTAPTPTKPSPQILSASQTISPHTVTVTARATLHSRDSSDITGLFESINSLQRALASATASAVSLSQKFAISVDQLQSSTRYLAASASGALLVAQASASSALAAAEASAAIALSAVEESAASSISEALALATSTVPRTSNDTYRTQLDNGDKSSVSPTIVGIAVAVSVVGSSLISLLVFFLIMRRRKAKQREQEEENEVNAALDRAIVSYIVKELPSPRGPGGQQGAQQQPENDEQAAFQQRSPGPTEPGPTNLPNFLSMEELPPTPPSPQSGVIPIQTMHQPSPQPMAQPPPLRPLLKKTAQTLPRSKSQRITKPPPVRMRSYSQTTPYPQVRDDYFGHKTSASDASNGSAWHQPSMTPSSIAISRAFSRRTASSHFIDSAEKMYGDILTSPLEKDPLVVPYFPPPPEPPMTTPPQTTRSEEPRREDAGWPLPARDTWL